MEDVKRILVACTMTRYCTKAIHYGFSLAKKYGAELFVLRVVYDPFLKEPPHMPYMPIPMIKKEYEQEVERAKQDLAKTISEEQGIWHNGKRVHPRGRAQARDPEDRRR